MIPIRDRSRRNGFPWVTFTIVVLLGIVYVWDRQWSLIGPRIVFADLAARPVDVMAAIRGGEKEPLVTLFTSIFLHANTAHVLGNVLFLWVFGPRVEGRFGPVLFMLYYLFWGVFASFTQIFVTPQSGVPMVGASGAIAGVMGSYFLLFPAARIEAVILPFWFWPITVPAWLLLGLGFLLQVFIVQPGVANWAHAGGFLAGMLLVILVGDRRARERTRTADTGLR